MKKKITTKLKQRLSAHIKLFAATRFSEEIGVTIADAEKRVEDLTQRINISQKRLYPTGMSTIEEVLSFHPQAATVLSKVNLTSCQKCAVRFDETLAEAADFYEFSLEYVLLSLRQLDDRFITGETSQ